MNDQADKLDTALAKEFTRQANLEDQFRTRAENQIGVPDYVTIASDAYQAYGRVTNFKNYQGLEMPSWTQLTPEIRLAWTAAVKKAIEEFVAHIFGDPGCFARAYAKGEPTFTLRAQDQTSTELVLNWIVRNARAPMHKLEEAFLIARAMQKWPDQKEAD